MTDNDTLMANMTANARSAARCLAGANDATKASALLAAAAALRASVADILAANAKDVAAAVAAGISPAMLDRLKLDEGRIAAMASAVEQVATLEDPVGQIIDSRSRPNGLVMERVRVPVGVLGIIYESRPNVTADAAALGLRSGNAVILRGGSEAVHSNHAIHAAMVQGVTHAGLPADAVQLVPTQDRAVVGAMLRAQGAIDMIIPRGGKSLVARVQDEARVPVLAHAEGLCHTYIHAGADHAMARAVLANAKMRRTGVCGATETLLIDAEIAPALLPALIADLRALGCDFRADEAARAIVPGLTAATDEDYATEWLDAILSVKVVSGVAEALTHIRRFGSEHTEAIITEDAAAAQQFLDGIASAVGLWNASTQFCDGGEFGFGAEIGIATGRLHARGPVGLEQLCTYRYKIFGTGQVRP